MLWSTGGVFPAAQCLPTAWHVLTKCRPVSSGGTEAKEGSPFSWARHSVDNSIVTGLRAAALQRQWYNGHGGRALSGKWPLRQTECRYDRKEVSSALYSSVSSSKASVEESARKYPPLSVAVGLVNVSDGLIPGATLPPYLTYSFPPLQGTNANLSAERSSLPADSLHSEDRFHLPQGAVHNVVEAVVTAVSQSQYALPTSWRNFKVAYPWPPLHCPFAWPPFSSAPVYCSAALVFGAATQRQTPSKTAQQSVTSDRKATPPLSPSTEPKGSTNQIALASVSDDNSESKGAVLPSQTIFYGKGDLHTFPYDLQDTDTLRMYFQKQPWWRILAGTSVLLPFCAGLALSVVVPFAVLYWFASQCFELLLCSETLIRDILDGKSGLDTRRPPECVLFCLALLRWLKGFWGTEALVDLSGVPLKFAWRDCLLWPELWLPLERITEALRPQTEKFWAAITTLSLLGHLALSYTVGAISFSVWDWWLKFTPSLIPPNVKTDTSDMGLMERWKLWLANTVFGWFAEGSGVIFQDYASFVACGRNGNPPTLLCYHPHSLIPSGLTFILAMPEFWGYRLMVAPALTYFAPLLRFFVSLGSGVKFGSAASENFKSYMKHRESCVILPGGVHEATLSEFGKEQLYLKNRRGFIKYSLQNGYSVTPVYALGQNLSYSQPFINNDEDHLTDAKLALATRGFPLVTICGSLFPPFLVIPKRYPILVVVGKPLNFPRIEQPTIEEINKYQKIYIEEIRKLYFQYAPSFFKYCKTSYGLQVPDVDVTKLRRAQCLGKPPDTPPLLIW